MNVEHISNKNEKDINAMFLYILYKTKEAEQSE